MLLHSKDDELIPISHALNLINKAKGNISFIETKGSHNYQRDNIVFQKIINFISDFIEEKPYDEEVTEDISPSLNCMNNFSSRNLHLRKDTERKNTTNQYFKLAQKALKKK